MQGWVCAFFLHRNLNAFEKGDCMGDLQASGLNRAQCFLFRVKELRLFVCIYNVIYVYVYAHYRKLEIYLNLPLQTCMEDHKGGVANSWYGKQFEN